MNNFQFEDNFQERRRNEYAVVIFLPRELNSVVAPFREKYDPIYNLVDAHITIVFPFDTTKSLEDISELIKMETDNFKKVLIELDSIADFYPKTPVIYWEVKKNEALCEMYYRLYSRLGIPIPFKELIPHVTIAREISYHRVVTVKDAIVSYLPSENFHAASIDLLTPLVNEKWVSVRSFSLK